MNTEPANQPEAESLRDKEIWDLADEIRTMMSNKHINNVEAGRLYGILIGRELIGYQEVRKDQEATDAFVKELTTNVAVLAPYVTFAVIPENGPKSSPMDGRDIAVVAQEVWRVLRPHRMSRGDLGRIYGFMIGWEVVAIREFMKEKQIGEFLSAITKTASSIDALAKRISWA